MNIILIGFSTTGKSTILKELKKELDSKIEWLDSDEQISKGFNNHIYQLYLDKFDPSDPIKRNNTIQEIGHLEYQFLEELMVKNNPYIAAIGPNVHIRDNWKRYHNQCKPLTIFLKANPKTVFDGLIYREEKIKEKESIPGFASWNQGVIRDYDPMTKSYKRLPTSVAMTKIEDLIAFNEKEYQKYADYTFESTKLFSWYDDYDEEVKMSLLKLIVDNAG